MRDQLGWNRYLKRLLVINFLIFEFIQAGITGKIVGTVTDAGSAAPLIGANVVIEGTSMGSATDLQGNYLILNVPPGIFSLKVSMIGYKSTLIRDVEVTINLTSTVNIQLSTEALGMEEVVVVAQRPVVSKDISNSQMSIQTETIQAMPLATVKDVLVLQAGIESGASGILIRGGDANQTVFMVDGLSMNDERSNNPYTAVALSSVQEIQVQTGGFNAEYGQARSGVVNVVMKEGDRKKYSGTLILNYSPAASKHFGRSVYDQYSYFNRPFFDPAVCWVGTDNGTWDTYTQNQYYKFEGWDAVSTATLQDNDPDNDITPTTAQRIFEWYHRRQGDIDKPDYVVDLGFGGPIPLLGEKFGSPRFYLTHYRLRDMFVIPLSRDAWDENHTQLKITTDLNPNMKLMLSGLYGEEYSVSPYTWTTTPTGRLLRFQSEVANLTESTNRGIAIPYMPGYFSPGSIFHQMYGAKFTHTLNAQSLYEIHLQYKTTRNNVRQIATRDTSKIYEIVPGYFLDEAPYGYSADGTSGPGSVHLGGWMNLGRDSTENSTFTIGVDYTTQFSLHNQIKTGIELVMNDYDIKSGTYSPAMPSWTRWMIYTVKPFRLGAYIFDQMDYEGFIANLGLRLDYSNGNTKKYKLDQYSKYYSSELGAVIEEDAPYQNSKAAFAISPRLGISHPITENSKLYFNYGHYRSEASSSYRFMIQRESSNQVAYISDPDLALEKTISYELGYEQGILDMLLLKIAAYYKDVSMQPGWVLYKGLSNVRYYKAANNNYADIRGFEVTLYKRIGDWMTGFINYTYDVRKSGYFGYLEYDEDPQEQRNYLRQNPIMTRRHPVPYTRLSLDLHTPDRFGPKLVDQYLLGGWKLNILADWRAGQYETFNPQNLPGIVDDVRWKDWQNVDMRISKIMVFGSVSIQTYVDISNVFNYKYMSESGFADSFDRRAYLESLNFSWEEGVEHGHDRIGDYRPVGVAYDPLEQNPNNDSEIAASNKVRKENKSYINMPNIAELTFLNPRDITFGVRVSF
ncbi:MAG: TonB-dependent receptor [Candidatus Neomarinimicrobiota bacterium]